jgi:phenylalanyl-tRNA synthetase alpha chain
MDNCNIPLHITAKRNKNLHKQKNHPIEIMKNIILNYFKKIKEDVMCFDNFDPVVTIENNFDKLLFSKDHAARSKSDTYYVDNEHVLRTHTSAHQIDLMQRGFENFIVVGDVYRKDEIDRTHYPVFHQIEGVGSVPINMDPEEELQKILNGLVEHLFPDCKYRINPDYFPFTEKSFEYEVEYRGQWLEILGCGTVHPDIISQTNIKNKLWAFGLGLERLVMIKFDIPDIRYLWSEHPRFLEQFSTGTVVKFKEFSEIPSVEFDLSFFIPTSKIDDKKWIDENNFFELVREVCGDYIEHIQLFDNFFHPTKKMLSYAYKIKYSPIDPNMTNPAVFRELCADLFDCLRKKMDMFDVILR